MITFFEDAPNLQPVETRLLRRFSDPAVDRFCRALMNASSSGGLGTTAARIVTRRALQSPFAEMFDASLDPAPILASAVRTGANVVAVDSALEAVYPDFAELLLQTTALGASQDIVTQIETHFSMRSPINRVHAACVVALMHAVYERNT